MNLDGKSTIMHYVFGSQEVSNWTKIIDFKKTAIRRNTYF